MTEIKAVTPLTKDEAREYELNYDKIMEEIASFDGYFDELGKARGEVERQIAERTAELREIEMRHAVELITKQGQIDDLKTQAKQLTHYDNAARSRISALKSIKQDFPKEPRQAAPSAL